ncbi:hypothetical protein [Asticcacaulis solisilvae]|uniref:hypothetical protein n=1 Tax=Asticcacaulis solisilvae TaxID=1217274 RepID=UPI003FD748E1
MRRLFPILSLFLLSPLVGEYLLGSLPMSMIAILPLMAAMYGSGALLIREVVRRTGKGWPSIVLLATAYGFIEEGFITQSLFNPNYMHLRLLDFGYLPAIGTALPWVIFVISIHVIWSMSVPIALTETLYNDKRTERWLGPVTIPLFALVFLAGSALIAVFTYKQVPFMASVPQLVGNGLVVVALIVAALLWPKPSETTGKPAPHAAILFGAALLSGSGLMIIEHLGPALAHWPWTVGVALMLGCEVAFVAFMAVFTLGRSWTAVQRFAVMAGGLMVYVWQGFMTDMELHGKADLQGHMVIAAAFVLLCGVAGWRAFRATR